MAMFDFGLGDFLSPKTLSGAGTALKDFGGAVGSFTAAQGMFAESNQYEAARDTALVNEQLARESATIQGFAASRKIEATRGAQLATVAANGFRQGGTALDLLRDSTTQGYLTKALIHQQGEINAAGFDAQARAAQAQREAADAGGIGDVFGGIMKTAATAAQIAAFL